MNKLSYLCAISSFIIAGQAIAGAPDNGPPKNDMYPTFVIVDNQSGGCLYTLSNQKISICNTTNAGGSQCQSQETHCDSNAPSGWPSDPTTPIKYMPGIPEGGQTNVIASQAGTYTFKNIKGDESNTGNH